jgi:hypothetical protein
MPEFLQIDKEIEILPGERVNFNYFNINLG